MKLKSILSSLLLAVITLNSYSQQTINGTIMHGGISREYILYIPASYSASTDVPLLFNFHGYTSNAGQQLFYGDFRPIADTANFIMVVPNGLTDDNGISHWNVGLTSSSVDDLGFTETLLNYLVSTYSIDESRVYSTGMSNGGFMSYYLACNMSDRFAAIGSVTGSMIPTWLTNCAAEHPTPVIEIHGTADPTVPYAGTLGMAPISDVVSHWVNYNNCTSSPTVATLPNTNLVDGSTVEKSAYLNGDNCSEVVHLKVINGAHTWPGSVIPLPGTNYDINASAEIWKFVSRFDINGLIGCPTNAISENELDDLTFFPNPSTGVVFIDSKNNFTQEIELFDSTGKRVLNQTVSKNDSFINLTSLENGIYFMQLNNRTEKIVLVK